FRTCFPSSLGMSALSACFVERGCGVIDAELATRKTLEDRADLLARRHVHRLRPLDVGRPGLRGRELLGLRLVRCRCARPAHREITTDGLDADVAMAAADHHAVLLATSPNDARGQLTFDVTARGAVFDGGVRLGERQIDVAADRL